MRTDEIRRKEDKYFAHLLWWIEKDVSEEAIWAVLWAIMKADNDEMLISVIEDMRKEDKLEVC